MIYVTLEPLNKETLETSHFSFVYKLSSFRGAFLSSVYTRVLSACPLLGSFGVSFIGGFTVVRTHRDEALLFSTYYNAWHLCKRLYLTIDPPHDRCPKVLAQNTSLPVTLECGHLIYNFTRYLQSTPRTLEQCRPVSVETQPLQVNDNNT